MAKPKAKYEWRKGDRWDSKIDSIRSLVEVRLNEATKTCILLPALAKLLQDEFFRKHIIFASCTYLIARDADKKLPSRATVGENLRAIHQQITSLIDNLTNLDPESLVTFMHPLGIRPGIVSLESNPMVREFMEQLSRMAEACLNGCNEAKKLPQKKSGFALKKLALDTAFMLTGHRLTLYEDGIWAACIRICLLAAGDEDRAYAGIINVLRKVAKEHRQLLSH